MKHPIPHPEPRQRMLSVQHAICTRYTCRDFEPNPVPAEIVMEILEVANRAPSTANTQPWEIFAAAGEPLKRLRAAFVRHFEKGEAPRFEIPMESAWPPALRKRREQTLALHLKQFNIGPGESSEAREHLIHNYRFFNAPAVLYLCREKGLGPWSLFDLGLFTQNVLLAALEHGLDTAPALMLVAYPDLIRKELEIPENLSVVFGVALGYGTPQSRPGEWRSLRRPIEEVVRLKGFESRREFRPKEC
ncbi:MAG TPA: nitroreductase [bacterium]|nr:nitroreductase [bacterium]